MFVRQLHIVNSYGPFAVMTKTRLEIEIQGSNDGVTWQTYEFKHKPGQLDRMPTWVAPHQPRLDWHMWFAALGDINNNIWLQKLIHRLLQGTPEVHGLFKTVPFIDRPPKMIRSQLYHYQFTDFDENGWWRRELIGSYSRPATLEDFY
ncbi:MAG: lipase maturation factor family protein [Pseudomonadales bacterium]|nr:lipase maturation factor family protein [Pseudomonadales bacterium]